MRRSRFSPTQIASILKEFDNGKSVAEITREHGVSPAAFYKWRSKYAGMSGKELSGSRSSRRRTASSSRCTPPWPAIKWPRRSSKKKPAARRKYCIAKELVHYGISGACRVLNMSKGVYYYWPLPKDDGGDRGGFAPKS